MSRRSEFDTVHRSLRAIEASIKSERTTLLSVLEGLDNIRDLVIESRGTDMKSIRETFARLKERQDELDLMVIPRDHPLRAVKKNLTNSIEILEGGAHHIKNELDILNVFMEERQKF